MQQFSVIIKYFMRSVVKHGTLFRDGKIVYIFNNISSLSPREVFGVSVLIHESWSDSMSGLLFTRACDQANISVCSQRSSAGQKFSDAAENRFV